MSAICSHLESIELTELPDAIAGCMAVILVMGAVLTGLSLRAIATYDR